MKITITNIGPVKKAVIDLAPLTVFIGPNNSGKSVVASMLYAAFSQTGVATARRVSRALRPNVTSDAIDDIYDEFTHFIRSMIRAKGRDAIKEMPDRVRQYLSDALNDSLNEYVTSVAEEIARATGSPLPGLRRVARHRATLATIVITSERPDWQVSIRISSAGHQTSIDMLPNFDEIWDSSPVFSRPSSVTRIFTEYFIRSCFRDVPLHTKYLPSARSGILQSHKALAGSLIRRSSFAGIQDLQIPAMTGVVADFLGEMVELSPQQEGPFAEEARKLEREILHGQITLRGEPNPDVIYQTSGGSYPLGRTSSMVSELAPVVLYLKYRLGRGDFLLIEEPEAHLHPATQVAFARCLVRLVNRGLAVGLTTHSEFFLQQLNNAIMAASLPDDQVAELGVSRERLDSREVAPYFFKPTASGTVVERLPIDPKQGIPEASFDTVTEQLYNETIALERRMGGQD